MNTRANTARQASLAWNSLDTIEFMLLVTAKYTGEGASRTGAGTGVPGLGATRQPPRLGFVNKKL